MPKKRHKAEEIVAKLRQVEVLTAQGKPVAEAIRSIGVLWLNDGSCVRLRPEYSNHVWSYDFVEDRTHNGRKYACSM